MSQTSKTSKNIMQPARRQFIAGCAGVVASGMAPAAWAQSTYPTKPIRVIIPFPPGGPTDIVGRIVFQSFSERVRQTVTVENRPGASGMIGADVVAKSPPDGYTLLVNVSGHVVNPSLYSKMPHDPLADFRPITNLANTPINLVVSGNSPLRSVAELIALVKAEPGKHAFASSSNGTPGHLMGELFKSVTKLDIQHVPYKGSAPALTDVVGGQVTCMFDSMPSSISLVKAGKLRALGVSSPKRVAILPDVPTFAEAGFPQLNLMTWYGLWGPAHLPQDLTQQIYQDVSKVLTDPDIQRRIRDAMADPVGDTPEHFAAYCTSEAQRYAAIVKSAGIKLQ